MVDDITYDFQVCEGVQGKAKGKEKNIEYQHCEECNVERMMYSHLGFYVCPSCVLCGIDIIIFCILFYSILLHDMT